MKNEKQHSSMQVPRQRQRQWENVQKHKYEQRDVNKSKFVQFCSQRLRHSHATFDIPQLFSQTIFRATI